MALITLTRICEIFQTSLTTMFIFFQDVFATSKKASIDIFNHFKNLSSSIFNFFFHRLTLAHTPIYTTFIVILYSLHLDWFMIEEEFRSTNYIESQNCAHLWELNQCSLKIPVMFERCLEWETCSKKHHTPGTLIWAEVIKRFLNSVLILDPRPMAVIFIMLFLFVDSEVRIRIMDICRDIIRGLLLCGTILGGLWVMSQVR
jgi:hypothetical protein